MPLLNEIRLYELIREINEIIEIIDYFDDLTEE
jgi:hypothetical protein